MAALPPSRATPYQWTLLYHSPRSAPWGEDPIQVASSRKGAPLLMTEVNYAEVKYIVLRKDGKEAWRQVESSLVTLPVEFVPTTRALADTAANFKANHRISLADAFAAALAKEKKAELVTCDPEFKPMEKEIKIKWIK